MRASWVAGLTRARLLLERRAGEQRCRAVAQSGSLRAGLGVLTGSSYGERLAERDDLAGAERGLTETLIWHLRILAGWLPASGASVMRALTAWFELVNIEAYLTSLQGGGEEPPPFVLGGLTTAWPHVRDAPDLEQAYAALLSSAWGHELDSASTRIPAGELSLPQVTLALRVSWAQRVRTSAPEAADWVAGAAALLVARELLVAAQPTDLNQLLQLPGIDARALRARSIEELAAALPTHAAWALTGIGAPDQLWRAELSWWQRVERDAERMVRAPHARTAILATVALLAADARRVGRALAVASSHSSSLMEAALGEL